ncbi:hypothetical protein GCM10023224_20880 [Streptomonospora halophila]|uniref:Uncharacterized protein n=1 Tax=Streptomonospora halophila TaxID=427369 RepID=A0ABP9GDZ3_9ACTN
MVRRIRGDPDVPPYAGSPEQREAKRKRDERQEAHRRFVAKALEVADFTGFSEAGDVPPHIRRLAEMSAATMADPQTIAECLNEDGPWDPFEVVSCIESLWPHSGYADWPRELGTYPGYLGGLRDRLGGGPPRASASVRLAPRRLQTRCTRCGAQWPSGWPGTEREPAYPDEPATGCPDCGCPWLRSAERVREHSVVDLHWMLDRFAPADPGPCPVCGAERVLANAGYASWAVIRQLDWACPDADPLAWPDPFDRTGRKAAAAEHYRAAVEPAVWESEAAHHAYWLAVDMLRLAAAAGEETEPPPGAVYEAIDGSGGRWVRDEAGWRPTDGADGTG